MLGSAEAWMRMGRAVGMALIATAVQAEPAGPQLPPTPKTSPAQQAIALYHQDHDPAPPPKPCRVAKGQDEITVCGKPEERSPDRIPLPNESGPRAGPRLATGEMPSTSGGVGGSPALQGKGAGLTLTLKPGSTTISKNED